MLEGGADPNTDVKYFETSTTILLVRRNANRKRWIVGRFNLTECQWVEPVQLKAIRSTETREEAEQALREYAHKNGLCGVRRGSECP